MLNGTVLAPSTLDGLRVADAKAPRAINTTAHKVAGGVRPCGIEIVDEEHGADGGEIVHLRLVLACLVIEGSAT